MKVLLISHTVFSRTGNVGKTLLSYFRDFNVDEMAQFYIHNEVPTDSSICQNYYRFTDKDAARSLISRECHGVIFDKNDIQENRETSRLDTNMDRKLYQFGTKRTGATYWIRNTLWGLNGWKSNQFDNWIKSFNPDIVFFMSGDYAFMYDIAVYAANLVNKPLVVCCVDEYYMRNPNGKSWLGRRVHNRFLKSVRRTMERSACIFTICDTMKKEYERLFERTCYTLHTAGESVTLPIRENSKQVSYIGNVGYGRYVQLIAIGRALKALNCQKEPQMIDVYSGSINPKYFELLTEENGIRFHGRINADEVKSVMSNSMIVIHTESFNKEFQDMTRYSVSTKIADSLVYGPCLLAYGPEGIASIDYLKENQAAYVITSEDDLQAGLAELIENAQLRADIVANARKLAQQNHTEDRNSKMLREKLEEIIAEG